VLTLLESVTINSILLQNDNNNIQIVLLLFHNLWIAQIFLNIIQLTV